MALPIHIDRIAADRFTPLVAFKKLRARALLESAVLEIGKSRYSILLVEEAFRLILDKRGVVKQQNETAEILSKDPRAYWDHLKRAARAVSSAKNYSIPIPAAGLGYLGYETAAFFDKIRLHKQTDELRIPDAIFVFGSLFLIFDHYKDEISIVAVDYDGQGRQRITAAKERLMDFDFRAYQTEDEFYQWSGDIESGKQEFINGVGALREHIIAGDIVQAVLSRRIRIETHLDPLDAYCRLRRLNPSPYLFYLDFDEFKLLGSSPELMVSLNEGTATIKPIAGTRPRGATRQKDIALERELLQDEKELAEHLMLVDLARNDLGRTARPGSVTPRALNTVERYSHVMHIVSEIEAQVAKGYDAYDLIRTTFPAGTVSGAPKIMAMELVSRFESVKRGPYAGLVGHFDVNGNFDSCITIRSLIYKDGAFYIQAGAGIVYDSVPQKEFEETMNKAGAMIKSLGIYKVKAVRNDEITVEHIKRMRPSHIVISPGPGRPKDAGISLKVIREFSGKIPILGVCLGHQCIIEAFGGKIIGAPRIVHGKTSVIAHDNRGVFRHIPQNVAVVRYHSLCGEPSTIPDCLEVTAETVDDRTIMGVRHKTHHTVGVQFHPESIGTGAGRRIVQNFFHYKIEEPQKMALLQKLAAGRDLTARESYAMMDEITDGELTDGQLGAFLGALAVKGVTPTELSQFVKVLRDKAGVKRRVSGAIDTCGTGGDGKHTFNISSAAALVCGAAGLNVAKHGNRAMSSKSGSYDFLCALGIETQGDLAANLASINQHHFAFFFAQKYHSAMRHVAKARQELKFRTVFNMIGPLANPMALDYQVAGVFSHEILDLYIESMKKLGRKRAMVVHSFEGMDEISVCDRTHVRELNQGKITAYDIGPEDFGIQPYRMNDLSGRSADENAAMFLKMTGTKVVPKSLEAIRAAICANAAAALYVAGQAKTLKEGYASALKLISSKKMRRYLNGLMKRQ